MNRTLHRLILPSLALVLTAVLVAWPGATVADPVPASSTSSTVDCHGQCSVEGLACSIGCWEEYRDPWETNQLIQCQIACEEAIDVCAAACY